MSESAGRRSVPLVRGGHVTWLEMGGVMLTVLLVLLLLVLQVLLLLLIWLLRMLLIWVIGEGDGID